VNDADDIEDMVASVALVMRATLRRAFDDGKTAGRREAYKEIGQKLLAEGDADAIASLPPTLLKEVPAAPQPETEVNGSDRAIPGSIRPTILAFLEKKDTGAATSEIVAATGIKENTVRGTLRAMRIEHKVHKVGQAWLKIGQGPWDKLSDGHTLSTPLEEAGNGNPGAGKNSEGSNAGASEPS